MSRFQHRQELSRLMRLQPTWSLSEAKENEMNWEVVVDGYIHRMEQEIAASPGVGGDQNQAIFIPRDINNLLLKYTNPPCDLYNVMKDPCHTISKQDIQKSIEAKQRGNEFVKYFNILQTRIGNNGKSDIPAEYRRLSKHRMLEIAFECYMRGLQVNYNDHKIHCNLVFVCLQFIDIIGKNNDSNQRLQSGIYYTTAVKHGLECIKLRPTYDKGWYRLALAIEASMEYEKNRLIKHNWDVIARNKFYFKYYAMIAQCYQVAFILSVNWDWEKIESLHDGIYLDKESNQLIVSKAIHQANKNNNNNNFQNRYYNFLVNIFSNKQTIIKNYDFKKSLWKKIEGFYEINSTIPVCRGIKCTLTDRAQPKRPFGKEYLKKYQSKSPQHPESWGEISKWYKQFCKEDKSFEFIHSGSIPMPGDMVATNVNDPESTMIFGHMEQPMLLLLHSDKYYYIKFRIKTLQYHIWLSSKHARAMYYFGCDINSVSNNSNHNSKAKSHDAGGYPLNCQNSQNNFWDDLMIDQEITMNHVCFEIYVNWRSTAETIRGNKRIFRVTFDKVFPVGFDLAKDLKSKPLWDIDIAGIPDTDMTIYLIQRQFSFDLETKRAIFPKQMYFGHCYHYQREEIRGLYYKLFAHLNPQIHKGACMFMDYQNALLTVEKDKQCPWVESPKVKKLFAQGFRHLPDENCASIKKARESIHKQINQRDRMKTNNTNCK